jgi:hypothetical protein
MGTDKTIDKVLASRLTDTEAVENGADPARP